MPALFLVLGIAVVVFIAAAGHPKHHALGPAPAAAGTVVELDRGMPPSVVNQVLAALGRESDPARLEALGLSLSAHYPLSSSELHAKARTLRAVGAPASTAFAAPVSTTAPAPLPTPTAQEAQEPRPSPQPERSASADFDAATVLQAAMRALVEETDPAVLDGFAESIRAAYPAAAEILAARAEAVRSSAAAPISEPPNAMPAPVATTPSPSPSASLETPS